MLQALLLSVLFVQSVGFAEFAITLIFKCVLGISIDLVNTEDRAVVYLV